MREIKLWLPGETYWGARSTDGELFFTEDNWGEGFVLESDYAQLRAENERLRDALEMVRDADNDCIKDGMQRWCTQIARNVIDTALTNGGE